MKSDTEMRDALLRRSTASDPVVVDALAFRRLTFLEILADGAQLSVNGIPWREAFERMEAIYWGSRR